MTRLQQSSTTLYQTTHRKLKPALAVAALIAGSVFGSTAQAEILQLDLSGPSFSGYLFFDTARAPADSLGNGQLYYSGFSYISTPLATRSTFPYTTNPINPYTGTPVENNASFPYLRGIASLATDPSCNGTRCIYNIEITNSDWTAANLSFFIRQPTNTNVLIDAPDSFAGARVQFTLWNDGNYSNVVFSEFGTISLPAVTPPVSAVPEPASWAMLLLGVGMVGGVARYRRRQSGTATSQYRVA